MTAPETPTPERLYARAGGMPFFELLVDRFYAGVASDPELLPSIRSRTSPVPATA